MNAPPGHYDNNDEAFVDSDSDYDDDDSEFNSEKDDNYDDGDGGEQQPEALFQSSGTQETLFIQQMPPSHADMKPEHNYQDDANNAGGNRRAMTKSPPELWMEYMDDVRNGRLKALKVTDESLSWFLDPDTSHPPREDIPTDSTALIAQIIQAVGGSPGLTHISWGRRVWQLATPIQQQALLNALATGHASTLTYWKMGNEEKGLPLGSPTMTEALLKMWSNPNAQWKLTELEMRGMVFGSQEQVQTFANILQHQLGSTLKQVNILGFFLHPKMLAVGSGPHRAVFDCVLHSITKGCTALDELRLCRCVTPDSINTVPLISPKSLQDILAVKPKWWRMGLDGLGLDDRHVQVLVTALKSSPSCKIGDLLSLQENPKLTEEQFRSPNCIEILHQMAKYQPGCISQPQVGEDGEIPASPVFNDVGHVMGDEMIRPMGQKAAKKKAKEEKCKIASIGKTTVDMKGLRESETESPHSLHSLESSLNYLANAIEEASRLENDNRSSEMWMKQAELYMKMNKPEKAQEFMEKIERRQQEQNQASTNDRE